MQNFKNFTENLMKVILIPDDSSDSVDQIKQSPAPLDNFSKTAADYLGNFDSGVNMDETDDDMECCEDSDDSEDTDCSSCSVFHDTDGLKVTVNGISFTFSEKMVEKIKSALLNTGDEETEETDDTEETDTVEDNVEDTEESNTFETDTTESDDDDDDEDKE